MNDSCLLAFAAVLLMWFAQVRSEESSNPRYVALLTLSSVVP